MSDFPDERTLRRLIADHNLFSCDGNGCDQPDCVWCTDVVERIQKSKEVSDENDD
jgi:hypothetical protein